MGGEKGSREGHREWGRGDDVDRGKWEHKDKMFKRIMNLYKIKFEMLSLLLKKKKTQLQLGHMLGHMPLHLAVRSVALVSAGDVSLNILEVEIPPFFLGIVSEWSSRAADACYCCA